MNDKLKAESGFQLVSRFNDRPSLAHMDDVLFSDGVNPGDIIQISGESGVGKSFLLLKFLVKALMPKSYKGLEINGLDASVIFIDTGAGVSILKMVSLMEEFIKGICLKNPEKEEFKELNKAETIEKIIKNTLKNLVILKTYNAEQLEMNCHSIEKILATDANMSLILIDSLTSYYWSEVTNYNSIKNMDLYLKSKIEIFSKYAEEYETVLVFTTQEYFHDKQTDFSSFLIKQKINLKKCEKTNAYTACLNSKKTLKYTITDEGFICSSCGYFGKFDELSNAIKAEFPNVEINSKTGTPGSFEVSINGELVYSKLRTLAFPDFDNVLEVVKEVESGMPPRKIEKQQLITSCIVL